METIPIIKQTFESYGYRIENDITTERYSLKTIYIIDCYVPNKSDLKKIVDLLEYKLKKEVIFLPSYKVGYLAIQVVNDESIFTIPTFKETIAKDKDMHLPLFLGRDINNELVKVDLAAMPHLLVAGTTGSGKSVGLKTIITSLLYNRAIDKMRMILVDMKQVELTEFSKMPNLLCPILNGEQKTINMLYYVQSEMNRRFDLLKRKGFTSTIKYNATVEVDDQLPYIVVVIDEIQNLLQYNKKEVEPLLSNILSMSRAAGIHFIVCTQRPSVDVLSGKIKANIPSKLCFKVSSSTDSNLILGAKQNVNKLRGKGHALLLTTEDSEPTELQVCNTTDDDVTSFCERLVAHYMQHDCGEQYFDDQLMHNLDYGV